MHRRGYHPEKHGRIDKRHGDVSSVYPKVSMGKRIIIILEEILVMRCSRSIFNLIYYEKQGVTRMDIVSACLCGINCKYDGKNNLNTALMERVMRGELLPVCPEVLGGLPIPRVPCEIKDGRVFTRDGRDVTEEFRLGAKKTLEIARAAGAKKAILKQRSPSCGCGIIYDGTFSGKFKEGNGVTAQLLLDNEIVVMTEKDFE